MIARISAGSFIKGAVAYNEEKVNEGEASVIDIRNFKDENITSEAALFRMVEQCRKSDVGNRMSIKKPVFSCSLNLNIVDLEKLERLREEKGEEAENDFYRELAGRYMEGMGYGKQPYIVYKHEDIDRTHIHIVSIRVDENRKKINDSNEWRRSERVRNQINEAMGLSIEGEERGEKHSQSSMEGLAAKRNLYIRRAGDEMINLAMDTSINQRSVKLRHKISNILKFVDENYRPKNMGEYNKILSQYNIKCKKVDALDKEGRRISGCQFGIINKKGEFVTHLIAGSRISEKFSFARIEGKFATSNGTGKDVRTEETFSRNYVKGQIESILKSPREIDVDYLVETLKVRGIETTLVKDEERDEVIGISFVDNLNGNVFTGSSIGRDFTYGNLTRSIELHNRNLTKSEKIVDRETYKKANKILSSIYNEKRKSDYYFESDMIKYLPNLKTSFIDRLTAELHLTFPQAESCFASYAKFKRTQLASIETKENGYQQQQIINALQFASRMDGDIQKRVDFLFRIGVVVKGNGENIKYISERKPDVWITYEDAVGLSNENLEKGKNPITNADVKPTEGLQNLTKTERLFVKMFVEGGDLSTIKGDCLNMVSLLSEDERKTVADKIVPCSFKAIKDFNETVRSIRRERFKESGLLESDYIRNIEEERNVMKEAAVQKMGVDRHVADALFDNYKKYQQEKLLPEVEEKERNAAMNRMEVAMKFANRIQNTDRRGEFLKRMEISVRNDNGVLRLRYDRKPTYEISMEELNKKTGLSVSRQSIIFAKDYLGVKPFSKKERDFVKEYVAGAELADGRYSTALAYLDKDEQMKARAIGVGNRVNLILEKEGNRNVDEIVRALLYRGFVIHPTDCNGETVYKVGRFNSNKEGEMTSLPYNIAEKLNDSNFREAYPMMKSRMLNGTFASPKMRAVMQIMRAYDFKDDVLLQGTIAEVERVNRSLATKMRECISDGKERQVDFERMARLVAEYNGETEIVLPSPSEDIQGTADCGRSQVKDIMDDLYKNNILLTMGRRLMKGDNPDKKEFKQKEDNVNNNKI